MKNKIYLSLFTVLVVFIAGCTTDVEISDNQKDAQITPDVMDVDKLCGNFDPCYEGIAGYNQDISLCDKIIEEDRRTGCHNSLNSGVFMFREYKKGESSSINTRPFNEKCENTCKLNNMEFKKGLYSVKDLQSIFRYAEIGEDGNIAYSACFCYP